MKSHTYQRIKICQKYDHSNNWLFSSKIRLFFFTVKCVPYKSSRICICFFSIVSLVPHLPLLSHPLLFLPLYFFYTLPSYPFPSSLYFQSSFFFLFLLYFSLSSSSSVIYSYTISYFISSTGQTLPYLPSSSPSST